MEVLLATDSSILAQATLLPDRMFSIGANHYEIGHILVGASGATELGLQATTSLTAAEKAALRLHVCDAAYDFSAATNPGGHRYGWDTNLDWSTETTRTVYLSLPANNALACAAPDLAGRDRIWTGELTVGMVTIVAPIVGYGFFSNGPAGALDETMFNIGRNGYVVDSVSVIDGDLSFNLTSRSLRDAEVDALRLHVCDTPFDFSDAVRSRSNNLYRWNDNLDWSSLSSRTLYLSLPEGYTLPPGAPTGLSAQSVSGKPGYLRLSWTPGRAPGGSSTPIVTDYEARYRKTGTTKWSPEWSFRDYGTPGFPYPPGSPVAPRGGNDAPLIYYLDPNTEYQVQVRATNSYGESGWSNQVSATTAQATTANDDGTADADSESGPAAAPSQPTVRRVANEPGC